jgi:hypothetical protein
LLRILVTDFCRSLDGARPASWPTLCCPIARLAANASVFVAHWRSDIAHFGSYNALARAVAQELDLAGNCWPATAPSNWPTA